MNTWANFHLDGRQLVMKSLKPQIFAVLFLALALIAVPTNAQVIFDNGVIGIDGLASQFDTNMPFDAQVADDFSLNTGNGMQYNISGITFRGIYFNPGDPGLGGVQNFNVFFYDDAGGTPTGGPLDPSGTSIASAFTTGFGMASGNANEYDWNLDISSSMIMLDPDTTYWVAVQALLDAPPQWGWSGLAGAGGNAQQGFPSLGVDYWTAPIDPLTGSAYDMQFQLLGRQKAVPEPTTGLLLVVGFVGVFARRRRQTQTSTC